jgi:DNA polymerase (family 10)
MDNSAVSDMFDLLSKLMEIHGQDPFRSKSYASAAYNIEQLPSRLEGIDRHAIPSLKGIGDSTARKIVEILDTGRLKALDDLVAATPPGVLEMLKVKGLGPKKIKVIWREMGIESIGELLYACEENRLLLFKGFGAKTQQNVKESVEFMLRHKNLFLYAECTMTADDIQTLLSDTLPSRRFAFTGAYRRQSPVLSSVEWVTTSSPEELGAALNAKGFMADDPVEGVAVFKAEGLPSLSFHLCEDSSMADRLFRTSAGEGFLEAWDAIGDSSPVESESDAFERRGIALVPACMREDAAILEEARRGEIPKLVSETDIRGVIHAHSDWSDGSHTLQRMAEAARDKGMEYLVITDHSRSAFYAGGLAIEKVREQHAEIDRLNRELSPFRIFKGIESDILNDGSLDYPDDVLASFDTVIASVHSNLRMSEEKAMQRLLAAIRNPYTTILGHMTGRLLLSRPGYPVDHARVIDACAEHGVAIEINAHPRRLDMDWTWIRHALNKGVMLSIDPDAHSIEGFGDIRYGILASQKGGLTATRNLSCMGLRDFEAWLSTRKRTGPR